MSESNVQVPARVKAAAVDALWAALQRQPAPIVVNLRALADHGDGALYFACILWGELLCQGISSERRAVSQVRLEFSTMDGRPMDPNTDTALPPSILWGGRFLAAVMANDVPMTQALFDARRRQPDFVDIYVTGLLTTVCRALQQGQQCEDDC